MAQALEIITIQDSEVVQDLEIIPMVIAVDSEIIIQGSEMEIIMEDLEIITQVSVILI
jgi:hypothetical protein